MGSKQHHMEDHNVKFCCREWCVCVSQISVYLPMCAASDPVCGHLLISKVIAFPVVCLS